jgi:hypothetical protein
VLFFHWAPRHEGVLGSGGIAPRILDLGTRWRWVVSFTSRPLCSQGKSPWHPLDRRLGGPQNRSWRGGEEKNSQPLPGLQRPIIQPVAQRCTTEVSQLLNTICCSLDFLKGGPVLFYSLNFVGMYERNCVQVGFCLHFKYCLSFKISRIGIVWCDVIYSPKNILPWSHILLYSYFTSQSCEIPSLIEANCMSKAYTNKVGSL